jgi:hypothetical protein
MISFLRNIDRLFDDKMTLFDEVSARINLHAEASMRVVTMYVEHLPYGRVFYRIAILIEWLSVIRGVRW